MELAMIVDCAGCVMKDLACSDCVVTMLLGPTDVNVAEHQEVFEVLANAKLTAPLRLVPRAVDVHRSEATG